MNPTTAARDLALQRFDLSEEDMQQLIQTLYRWRLAALNEAWQTTRSLFATELPDWAPIATSGIQRTQFSQLQEAQATASWLRSEYRATVTAALQRPLDVSQQELVAAFVARQTLQHMMQTVAVSARLDTKLAAHAGVLQAVLELQDAPARARDLFGVQVLPTTYTSNYCKTYAGRIYSIQEASTIPVFPAHSHCSHTIALVRLSEASTPDSAETR
jgi:hypothetical protein